MAERDRHRLTQRSLPRWQAPAGRPPRILIVRLSALGDVLHALPVAHAIRLRWPNAHVGWVVEDRAADVLSMCPDIDVQHVFERKSSSRALRRGRLLALSGRSRVLIGGMRRVAYDLSLDLQGNLKSGLIARASGALLRYGWDRSLAKEGNQVFSHHRSLPLPEIKHKVLRNLAMFEEILQEPVAYAHPTLLPTPTHEQEAKRCSASLPSRGRGRVILHPGTSNFGSFKRWPGERWAALAQRLHADGYDVVLTHTAAEEPLVASIAQRAPGLELLAPPSIGALAVVARDAHLFVAADTGPLHLAALMGTPVLGLYGPKDPDVYGPFGVSSTGAVGLLPTVVQDDVACRPCRLRNCANPICMTTMAPERVADRCRTLLA